LTEVGHLPARTKIALQCENLLFRFAALDSILDRDETNTLTDWRLPFSHFMRDKVEPCQPANAELTYPICRFDIPTFTSSQLNARRLAIPRLPARSITRDAVNESKLRSTILDGEIVVLDRMAYRAFSYCNNGRNERPIAGKAISDNLSVWALTAFAINPSCLDVWT
jgi:hypothetical protein